jgi:hypothetical protein
MLRKKAKYAVPGIVVLFAAAQLVQPDRTNPPPNPAGSFAAVANPHPETAAILQRACADCHSNETAWPWYSRVSPVSWLVANDVKEGRAHLNLSEWNFLSPEASRLKLKDACRKVKAGEMPLWQYKLLHPEERICAAAESLASLRRMLRHNHFQRK